MRSYYVYILTNNYATLYIGVTNDLERRMYEHKQRAKPGFASKYNCTWLLYYEETNNVSVAITREKQLKGWLRKRKVALIESVNPDWRDLSADWFGTT